MDEMEILLHYVWQHKLFAEKSLVTTHGQHIDVIDPGIHNRNAGPDFFNAKVVVDGITWVGNVEIHQRASDWFRHRHQLDPAYDNVVLHVCAEADGTVQTLSGQHPPQTVMKVPDYVARNYRELIEEDTYPPCYRVIPAIPRVNISAWLSALTTERLQEKTRRIERYLAATNGDWERAFFITLARNFGFGTNSEAFEEWALRLPLHAAAKHRDDLFQLEALFFGQAGLLDESLVAPERRDEHYRRLAAEYRFLAHKFSLAEGNAAQWKFGRLRPQNFPHVRLSQLVELYHSGRTDLSRILEAKGAEQLRHLLRAKATDYWTEHYSFGRESATRPGKMQNDAVDLLLINTAAPLLFAYGRTHFDEDRCERAFQLLEELKAERNFITRSWDKAGITARNAADSQALIHLRNNYCDRKDCLRCRFGCEYLRRLRPQPAHNELP